MITHKKINFILIGVILILVSIIIYTRSTSKDSEMETDGLRTEISEHKEVIESLLFDNEELRILSLYQKEKDSISKAKIDSLLKISYEIPNPKDYPVPKPNARNDSIRKWSKRFQ